MNRSPGPFGFTPRLAPFAAAAISVTPGFEKLQLAIGP